jgi:hypothetical protein
MKDVQINKEVEGILTLAEELSFIERNKGHESTYKIITKSKKPDRVKAKVD